MESQIASSLSIAIVCYHSPKDELTKLLASLLESLRNLRQETPESNITVCLVDNSEEPSVDLEDFDELAHSYASLAIEIRLLHGQGNIGYGAAHNLALQKAESEFHLLLNPDVIVDPDCLKNGLAYLRENQKVVIVSPFATDKNLQKQYLCKRYPAVLTFLVRGFLPGILKNLFQQRLAKFEMHELSESRPGIDIPIVSGCFMLCRTDMLKSLNGFDENYFLYFEDFDLSLRAAKEGRIDYLPSMKIIHDGGNAAKKGISHLKMFAKSGIQFFNTHGWRFFTQ